MPIISLLEKGVHSNESKVEKNGSIRSNSESKNTENWLFGVDLKVDNIVHTRLECRNSFMTKLGIDIVDLKDEKLRKRDDRALKLIINNADVLLLHKHIFWLLWAAKEAVFKCKRECNHFTPKDIPIVLSENEKSIIFKSNELEGSIHVNDECVMAIAAEKLSSVAYHVFENQVKSDSQNTRKAILDFFKNKKMNLEIGTDAHDLPVLLPSGEPITISHHGSWSAFAYPAHISL